MQGTNLDALETAILDKVWLVLCVLVRCVFFISVLGHTHTVQKEENLLTVSNTTL